MILLHLEVMNHLGASRAFLPKARRQIALFVGIKRRTAEDTHDSRMQILSQTLAEARLDRLICSI